MTRTLKYNKNGFDILCDISSEFDGGEVMYKPYGSDEYVAIGRIYKTTTGACGTTRDTATWHHRYAESPITKKSWHQAAKDLYSDFRKEAA